MSEKNKREVFDVAKKVFNHKMGGLCLVIVAIGIWVLAVFADFNRGYIWNGFRVLITLIGCLFFVGGLFTCCGDYEDLCVEDKK